MADGMAALQAQIAELRRLARDADDLPARVADGLRDELQANIAAGRDPNGRQWQPTQDGRRPLTNAAKALDVRATGNTVFATLVGVEAKHHLGAVKGKVKRQILRDSRIPDSTVAMLQRIAAKWWAP